MARLVLGKFLVAPAHNGAQVFLLEGTADAEAAEAYPTPFF